jgi:hypothetical protein
MTLALANWLYNWFAIGYSILLVVFGIASMLD